MEVGKTSESLWWRTTRRLLDDGCLLIDKPDRPDGEHRFSLTRTARRRPGIAGHHHPSRDDAGRTGPARPAPGHSRHHHARRKPSVAFYRDLYDRIGRPWLWYERRLLSDAALASLLGRPGHELHVARHDGDLVGYFELDDDELVFFGLTLAYIGRRIGPWLLDRAIERAFARGVGRLT